MGCYGIDISEWQGKNYNISQSNSFVILRAGYSDKEDACFSNFAKQCINKNIKFGVYWYSYARTPEKVQAEIDACLKTISPFSEYIKSGVGVWIDMEDADGWKARNGWKRTKENVSAICNRFCAAMEAAGYYAGIYASYSWLAGSGRVIECPLYDKWVAHYHQNDGTRSGDYSSLGSIHQYTSKPIDKSYMYVDISRFDMTRKKKKETKKYKIPNLILGMHHLNVTQLPRGNYSHPNLAMDLAGEDLGIDFYVAKACNWKCIAGMWGYGTYFFVPVDANGKHTEVMCADGVKRYVTLALTHSNCRFIKTQRGKIYKKDSPMYEEGGKGGRGAYTFGNHIHLEIAEGYKTTKKWNNRLGVWTMGDELDPTKVFFILDGYTTTVDDKKANFKHTKSLTTEV